MELSKHAAAALLAAVAITGCAGTSERTHDEVATSGAHRVPVSTSLVGTHKTTFSYNTTSSCSRSISFDQWQGQLSVTMSKGGKAQVSLREDVESLMMSHGSNSRPERLKAAPKTRTWIGTAERVGDSVQLSLSPKLNGNFAGSNCQDGAHGRDMTWLCRSVKKSYPGSPPTIVTECRVDGCVPTVLRAILAPDGTLPLGRDARVALAVSEDDSLAMPQSSRRVSVTPTP